MILPSKELISEVLSKEVEEEIFIDSNSLTYVNSGIYEDINIYELAHKCKEWANKKYKACLISGYCKSFGYKCFTDNPYELQYIKKVETQTADTEPEAIFKACEYIMEQTKCGS